MFRFLKKFLVKIAQRTPYTHLLHSDGTLYMQRFWLMPKFLLNTVISKVDIHGVGYAERVYYRPKKWLPFAIRLHHIATHDYDKHFHDHPWSFFSLILSGGYIEQKPRTNRPCFHFKQFEEAAPNPLWRLPGDFCFRRAKDRHRILEVMPGTWTLIIHRKKTQPWGFYTRMGKIQEQEYKILNPKSGREEV